jgi:hypothetical protein
MKVIILLGLLAVAMAMDYQEEWQAWKSVSFGCSVPLLVIVTCCEN